MNRCLRAAIAVLLALVASTCFSAERYVTDQLRITLRAGAGNQYRIKEILETGTPLETLEERGEWTQVRLSNNTTGWVRRQYLTDSPVAAARLDDVRTQLQETRHHTDQLESRLAQTRDTLATAQKRVQDLETTRKELTGKLAAARKGLKLSEENARLKETAAELRVRIHALEQKTARLADRRRRKWFMIGAGVLLAGIVFGIVVTRIPWRRSRRDRMF